MYAFLYSPSIVLQTLQGPVANALSQVRLFLRKETGHLLFSHWHEKALLFLRTASDRHGSASPLLFLSNSLSLFSLSSPFPFFPLQRVSMAHSCTVYGGIYATYNMDIAHAFKEFLFLCPFPASCPSNFPYSTLNRSARLSKLHSVQMRPPARLLASLLDRLLS